MDLIDLKTICQLNIPVPRVKFDYKYLLLTVCEIKKNESNDDDLFVAKKPERNL